MRRRTGDGLNPRGRKTNKGGDPRGSHLLAAVRPHEPRGEHHLLVYRLLCHGGRAALRGSVRRAPRTRAVVGGSSPKGINLTRMAFFLCRAISGRRVPARPRQGMGFSLESRLSGANARRPHSSARDRRTERGTPVRSTPAFRVCRSRHARARETSARGGEQSVISRVASAGEATASRATASCSSTSTWRRTSSWSRGTSGRTCRRCCGRSSRTRCVQSSIGEVGRDARSTNPKKMRGARNETGVRIGSAFLPRRGANARAHRPLRKSASLH